MQPGEQQHIDVVLRYFDGCNTGELDDLLPRLAEDVIHYFLPESFPTIRDADHLAQCSGRCRQGKVASTNYR
jgi:ketosteroid isomerase-like protein